MKPKKKESTPIKPNCSEDNLLSIGNQISGLEEDLSDLNLEMKELNTALEFDDFDYAESDVIESDKNRRKELQTEIPELNKEINNLRGIMVKCGKNDEQIEQLIDEGSRLVVDENPDDQPPEYEFEEKNY